MVVQHLAFHSAFSCFALLPLPSSQRSPSNQEERKSKNIVAEQSQNKSSKIGSTKQQNSVKNDSSQCS